ncbi:MAG: TonB-dependent receptor [Terricaulis sp.]
MVGTRRNLKWMVWSAAMAAAAGHAWAQETPTPAPAPQAEPAETTEPGEDEEIIVVATQGDDVRIDRRVYTLSEDPAAQTMPMLDVLSRIPSVSVAPSGAVRLLGSGNVTIQIDGQPVPGASLESILRSLTGSGIERIEVITNPSAQYSPQGNGGIINIITRDRFSLGLTGSVTGAADSTGGYQFNASPTWTRDAWSFGARLNASRNTWEGVGTTEREVFATGDTIRDSGAWAGDGSGMSGGFGVNYRPGGGRRMGLNVNGYDFENDTSGAGVRSNDAGPLYEETSGTSGGARGGQANFNFQQTDEASGQVLKINLNLSNNHNDGVQTRLQQFTDGSPTRQYRAPNATDTNSGNAKVDFERPLGEGRLITLGAALDQSEQTLETGYETLAGTPAAPDFQTDLRALQTTGALYATYQTRLGDWTLMPGVRAEHYRREIRSPGGENDQIAVDAYPSLHLRRNLIDDLDLDLSYSQRIARPPINQLDPAVRFLDPTRASTGNPNLQPSTTDAYEATLVYQTSERTYNVTLFDRISDDVFSSRTETTPGGVILTMPINAGTSEARGAQLIMRAPLMRGWRYALSANLLNREFDALEQGAITRRSEFEYSGSGQIEYRDRNQSELGADHVQLEVQFQGPRYEFQTKADEFVTANFTWRRRLTDKISSVFTVQDIFDSAPTLSELRTDAFFERSEERGVGTRFRLALTYQFGGAGGPPEDQAPAPTPGAPQ